MAETLTIELHNRQQARAALKGQLFPFLAQVLQGGKRWVLTVSLRKRTSKQNKRYWGNGVLKQIAEQAAPGGKLYSAEIWHEQFKRMFIGVVELPDGSFQGMSSTELDTAQFCEFSDKVEAYAATELGVTFYDLQGPNAKKASSSARVGDLCWRAVQWCKEPEFWAFLTFDPVIKGMVSDEAGAKHYVQTVCGIESRKELDTNPEAARKFNQLIRGPYQKHLIARGVVR